MKHLITAGCSFTSLSKPNIEFSVNKEIPLEHIVLETDAPYLAPVPHRGKRKNESSFIPIIAQKVAEIKGCSIDKVAVITTGNVARIFPA